MTALTKQLDKYNANHVPVCLEIPAPETSKVLHDELPIVSVDIRFGNEYNYYDRYYDSETLVVRTHGGNSTIKLTPGELPEFVRSYDAKNPC